LILLNISAHGKLSEFLSFHFKRDKVDGMAHDQRFLSILLSTSIEEASK